MGKHWDDQPDEVEGHTVVFRAFIYSHIVEVRSASNGGPHFYVTGGNLFGSQTVRCVDAPTAFRVMDATVKASLDDKPFRADSIDGVVLLANKGEAA
jgi:hypothetical protein